MLHFPSVYALGAADAFSLTPTQCLSGAEGEGVFPSFPSGRRPTSVRPPGPRPAAGSASSSFPSP